jgi:hypothetical protein
VNRRPCIKGTLKKKKAAATMPWEGVVRAGSLRGSSLERLKGDVLKGSFVTQRVGCVNDSGGLAGGGRG